MAQGRDGTIYLREADAAGYPLISALDGQTAAVTFRITLPHTFSTTLNVDCIEGWNFYSESGAQMSPLSVGADGTAYAQVGVGNWVSNYLPRAAGRTSGSSELSLLAVRPDGTSTRQVLQQYTDYRLNVDARQMVPDSEGGVLAPRYESRWDEQNGWTAVLRGAYVRHSAVSTYTLPAPDGMGQLMLAGEDGLGYLSGYVWVVCDRV